ncbi:GNAT family N-acetyltransferase [Companilactobacillus farciminis]|uniref:GNAT family N-acetyltransferase n=1 Tax=Companilactobacillus farciminis TaxID=1612 RepID=UPI00232EB3EA|nr:GNAT family N-acetyltransferase [Companilactobacillus farciminis]WCG36018.1 GNAT family N-acetyltransferase [Companilactobacillus farciminis]
MNLIGNKIIIRDFQKKDFPEFFELVYDKTNHDLAGLEYTTDENFAHSLLEMYQRRDGAFVIAKKDTDQMVGIMEMNKRGESGDLLLTREVGFVVNRKFRKQGFAKESVQLLIEYGFNDLNLTEIWASSEKDNQAPQNLLESLGFKYIYEVNQALPYAMQSNLVKYYLLKK